MARQEPRVLQPSLRERTGRPQPRPAAVRQGRGLRENGKFSPLANPSPRLVLSWGSAPRRLSRIRTPSSSRSRRCAGDRQGRGRGPEAVRRARSREALSQTNASSSWETGHSLPRLTGCGAPARKQRGPARRPALERRDSELGHGVILEIRVYQLASAVRVAPQLPIGAAKYCDSVQVCPMNSEATQMSLPTVTAIP
jgi:hypothetical protein